MIYLPRAILFTFVYIPGDYIEGRFGDLQRGFVYILEQRSPKGRMAGVSAALYML